MNKKAKNCWQLPEQSARLSVDGLPAGQHVLVLVVEERWRNGVIVKKLYFID
jgi:hypothetical protein